MPFPKKYLNANETIALDMHPHWWYFAEPAWSLLGSIVLGIVVLAKTRSAHAAQCAEVAGPRSARRAPRSGS